MSRFDERILNGAGVFVAIVRAGSFAAAGEQLGMSQPGVSRAVSRLEARLGIRLFDRSTRVIALTDEGRRFHADIAPLLVALEEAALAVSKGACVVRGHLRVNLDPFFSRLILGPRLDEFLTAHPQLELSLVTRDQLGDMLAEGFDLAVRFGVPRSSSLVARKLLDTRVVTVATPAYLRRHGRPALPQELTAPAHVRIDFRDPETGRPFDWEFHRRGRKVVVPTEGRLVVNDVGTLHEVCLAGYGVAQVMELGCEALLADGRLVDLFPDWSGERFPLYALYPSRQHPPARVSAFLEFVGALTQALPGRTRARR